MQGMKRFNILLILMMGFFVSISQAQATCDGQGFVDVYNEGYDAYVDADYDRAINYYNCAIALVPDNFLAGGEDISEVYDYAAIFLNRGWAYFMNGNFDLVHADFYQWLIMTEIETIESSIDELMGAGNLEITFGQVYRMSFDAEAGQIWGFSALTSDSLDPLIALLDPNGELLTTDDDGGINLNAVIRRYTMPTSGTYTLVLGQAGAWGTGEIELAVYQDGEVRSSNPDNSNALVSFATYYLYVGETAEVFTTNGDRLNLREGAGVDFEIIDRLESGERVSLLEGPLKRDDGDGYSWWRIRTEDGVEGWAVERVETEQTLQLALYTGEEAQVVSAPDLLNVRESASRSAAVAFQLEDGAIVSILEDEPVIADGLRWWHIRDAEGREGWAVDRIGIERTLAPVREFPMSEMPE